jgi:hypothetical protein
MFIDAPPGRISNLCISEPDHGAALVLRGCNGSAWQVFTAKQVDGTSFYGWGEISGTWTGLACPGHGLALGTDVDNATLQHLAAGSEIADLTWEAPDELTTEHAKVFQAAMRAHHAGNAELAEQLWESSRPSGRRPGQRTTQRSSSCKARA